MVYPEFKKDRASWSDDDNKRINEAITSLRENPRAHGCEKLSGESDNYRLRVGNYRILYSIQDGTVMLVTVKNVADRKDVYKAR